MFTYNSDVIKVVNEPSYVADRIDIYLWEIVPGHCDRVQFQMPGTTRPDPISELVGKKINVYDPADPTKITYTWTVSNAYVRDNSVLPLPGTYDLIELWLVDDNGDPADLCFEGLGPIIGEPADIKSPLVSSLGFVSDVSITYDSASSRYVMAFIDINNNFALTTIVGRKSGTDIVWGEKEVAELYVAGEYNPHPKVIYDPVADRIVILYRDKSTDNGVAIVGTLSGSSISFGSPTTFYNLPMGDVPFDVTYDTTNERIVACFVDNSGHGTAVVIETVPDLDPLNNTINAGAPTTFDAVANITWVYGSDIAATFDSSDNVVVITYIEDGTRAGYTIAGSVSIPANTITFGTRVQFQANSVERVYSVFDTVNNNFTIAYTDSNVNMVRTITGDITPIEVVNFPFAPVDVYSEPEPYTEIPIVYDPDKEEIILFTNSKTEGDKAFIGDTSSGVPVFGDGTILYSEDDTTINTEDAKYIIDEVLNPVYNPDSKEILLTYINRQREPYGLVGMTYNSNTDDKPTDFYLVSESILPNVAGGWLKMRPYSHNPLVKADSDKLFQGREGVNIGKDLTMVPDIDIEMKIIPSSIYVNDKNPNKINWWDFDSIFIPANQEFSIDVPGLDIYDIYLRATGTGTGYVKIVIVGTGYPF